ncbi:MAG: ComEC/Rec2 family competence protein [Agathobacter sp.]|nr:ComEC/Rec2 family competence protein [Agathobacter sp.]
MRERPCLLFACIFLTGIVYQRYEWKVLWLVPLVFLLLELFYGIGDIREKARAGGSEDVSRNRILKRIAGRSLVLLSAFFLGMCQMKSQEEFRNAYMSKLQDNSNAVIYGEIINLTETDFGYRLILTDCYVSLKEANIPCNKVMVYVSSDQFRVGQIYQFKGQLHFFEGARNEGSFDSALFYQSQKIDFFLYEESSILLDSNENVLRDGILSLKLNMEQVYKKCMSEAAAGFYMGMMLGDKSLLSEETKDLFAIGGISHILAISGLHMSIIGRGFYSQLRKHRVGFLAAGILSSILVLAYCYMVGSGVSAIRAVGMMLLFFLSQYIGRSYDMLNALGVVVIYLLWDNPFLIEYSGFQFSVAALIGVGFVGKYMWMSLGITLTTLPIVACCYYEVPLYSSFVNAIILPMVNPIFVLALFGGVIGSLLPFIGWLLLIPCSWLFYFYEFVCEFVARLPFGNVITGAPKLELVVGYYLILFLGVMLLKRVKKDEVVAEEESDKASTDSFKKGKLRIDKKVFISALLTIICFTIIVLPRSSKSEIIFLDVGQGDGIYISSEDGTTCFIDGGSSDVKQVGTYRILPFLKAHGVRQIDYWFVSHADMDHISGLLEVMEEGYEIEHLVISDKMPEEENRERLLSVAKTCELDVILMSVGDSIVSKQLVVRCLYPWLEGTDKNELSMVLQVEFFNERAECLFRGLFSADISSDAERKLLEKDVLKDVDLYKAAHHGSKYSNSQVLLDVIQPEICVISCGEDNVYGHPHIEVVNQFAEISCLIYTTADLGQISISFGAENDCVLDYMLEEIN